MTCSITDPRKLKTSNFGVDSSDFDGFVFTGKQWDEDVELYYFNARWYDPETGRFITEDPIKDGLLWFAYVNNNPMGFVDPTGLRAKDKSNSKHRNSRRQERKRQRKIDNKQNNQRDFTQAEAIDRKSNISSIRNRWEYMEDYKLTDSEIKDYSEFIEYEKQYQETIQNMSMAGASIEEIEAQTRQLHEKFLSILHLQTELTPDGHTACNYMATLAGVQNVLLSPMPLSMINELTGELSEDGILTGMDQKVPGYGTRTWNSVANRTLSKLGYDDLKAFQWKPNGTVGSFLVVAGQSINTYHYITTFGYNISDSTNPNFYYYDSMRLATAIDLTTLDTPYPYLHIAPADSKWGR